MQINYGRLRARVCVAWRGPAKWQIGVLINDARARKLAS